VRRQPYMPLGSVAFASPRTSSVARQPSLSDILKDCALKEGRLLLHESDIAPQPIRIEVGNVVAVQENLSSSGLIPSLQ
jgi:hypothetical protein